MEFELFTGDCIDVMRALPAASFDAIITDPPYGETSLDWDRHVAEWTVEAARLLKPTGSLWCFGSLRFFMERAKDFADWTIAQDTVWEKHNGTNMFNDRFRRVHEHAIHAYRGAWRDVYKKPLFTHDARARVVRRKVRPAQWGDIGAASYASVDGGPRLMRSVMFCRSMHGSAVHPTQKPVEVVAPLIEYSCPPGGRVLDPFMGSGTTGVAAAQLGCDFVGIELRADFVAIAGERIAHAYGLDLA
ncbi:site-specific DNA-methyltransferase [Burkholderia sp. IDO3]|uniref:DNA-methyltransferase n=1 Tax=Burkholderia sp. IDO3 TaxID=1705310 RepID=UPI000BBAB4FF|nr:site-specific DNA-methyltransferase [Burkholderia sp. IDO3]AXK65971.1 site-specific DNA-methyltransferase [Burkholderia sp. IDO3]PCD57033.1 site-specific DNA-methyltransferase [Burkholderia sp. IDO3]